MKLHLASSLVEMKEKAAEHSLHSFRVYLSRSGLEAQNMAGWEDREWKFIPTWFITAFAEKSRCKMYFIGHTLWEKHKPDQNSETSDKLQEMRRCKDRNFTESFHPKATMWEFGFNSTSLLPSMGSCSNMYFFSDLKQPAAGPIYCLKQAVTQIQLSFSRGKIEKHVHIQNCLLFIHVCHMQQQKTLSLAIHC